MRFLKKTSRVIIYGKKRRDKNWSFSKIFDNFYRIGIYFGCNRNCPRIHKESGCGQ